MKKSPVDISLIKDGDIIVFHTGGFSPISVGIRILTGSYWNHTGVIIFDKEFYVIEALGKVVKTSLNTYLNSKNYDVKIIRLKKEAFKDENEYNLGITIMISRMVQSLNTKYDYFAIVYLGIKYTTSLIWKQISKLLPQRWNPFQQRSKFFCSELVCCASYKISSIIEFLFQGDTKQRCDSTTPKDIAKSKNINFITGNEREL